MPKQSSGSTGRFHPELNSYETRRVAAEAMCDHRTVIKYMWGQPQPDLVRARIAAALAKCNFGHLVGSIDQRLEAAVNRAKLRAVQGAPASSPTNGTRAGGGAQR